MIPSDITPPTSGTDPGSGTTVDPPVPSGAPPIGDTISSDPGTTTPTLFSTILPGSLLPTLEPGIPLNVYHNLLVTNLNNMRHVLGDTEWRDQFLYKGITQNSVNESDYLQKLRSFLKNQGAQWVNLINTQNAQINSMNASITLYNSQVSATQPYPGSDLAETQLMNNAIAAYNAGLIDDITFNAAVTQYNNYMAGRNATLAPFLAAYNSAVNLFNIQVAQNNVTIAQLNAGRAALGLPLLPYQLPLSPASPFPLQAFGPLLPPVPSIPLPTTIPLLSNVSGPTSVSDIMDTYYKPIEKAFDKNNDDVAGFITRNKAWKDYQYFFLAGRVRSAPNAYIFPNPSTSMGASTGSSSSGSGVGLTQLIVSSDSGPTMSGVLQNMIWNNEMLINGQPIDARVAEQIAFDTLNVLRRAGLLAGTAAIFLLIDKIPFIDIMSSPSAISVNFGILFAVAEAVKLGVFKRIALDRLIQSGVTGEAALKQAEALGANINLAVLLLALLDTSITLGAPGLIPQLLGLAVGTGTIQDLLSQQTSPLETARNNPVALEEAIRRAADELEGRRQESTGEILDRARAEQIARETFQELLAQDNLNADLLDAANLRSELIQAYRERGIAEGDAIRASYSSTVYLQEELDSSYLNSEIVRDRVNSDIILTRIVKEADIAKRTIDAVALQNDIKNEILLSDLRTKRDLRDRLAALLVKQGIDELDAFAFANSALVALGENDPQQLREPGLRNQKDPAMIYGLLAELTMRALESNIGKIKAEEIAREVAYSIIGQMEGGEADPNSIYSQVQDQIAAIQQANDNAAFNTVLTGMYSILNPNIPVIQITEDIYSLAFTYLKTHLTGITYGDNIPNSEIRSVDIVI